ncbi:MAG: hypothetical protein HUJ25_17920 [Crocinitomicaceae bacterium]|nr:hypothetical protein [Crocinitomicaceae bacterium]
MRFNAKHIILVTFNSILMCSCSSEEANDYGRESINLGNQEIKSDTISHNENCVDSTYLYWFKNGEFDKIISDFENKMAATDFQVGIYNLSLFESSRQLDFAKVLSKFPKKGHWHYSAQTGKFYYGKTLLSKLGSMETFSLICYDFMNSKDFDSRIMSLIENFYFKSCDTPEENLFFQLHENTRYHPFNPKTNSYLDSLKSIFPHWTYLDSLKKYYDSSYKLNKARDQKIWLSPQAEKI